MRRTPGLEPPLPKSAGGGAYHWHVYRIGELLPAPAGDEVPYVLLLGCGDGGEKRFLTEAGFRPLGVDVRLVEDGAIVLADAHFLPWPAPALSLSCPCKCSSTCGRLGLSPARWPGY